MTTPAPNKKKKKLITIILIVALSLLGLAAILVILVMTWPNKIASLQQPFSVDTSLSYDDAMKRVADISARDATQVNPANCASFALTHGKKVKKSVVMLHGITACPNQFSGLAKTFYDAGYNVYVPRTPYHGTGNDDKLTNVTVDDLRNYVTESVNIAAALGDDTGIVGISGGADLATWAVQRSDVLTSALFLSPFYAPSLEQSPRWQFNPLVTLYGNRLLPDAKHGQFWLRTLAAYLLFTKNYDPQLKAPQLKHVAVATSALDRDIDLEKAHRLPRELAAANGSSFREYQISKAPGVTHDNVGPNADGMAEYGQRLWDAYLALYENRPAKQY